MWIVRLALRRPYTFVVTALLIVILGVVSIAAMPTDVFPGINIPVISIVYNYSGMSAEDMETRVLTQFERFVVTTVNDIEHTESQALSGIGVVKIFFQRNAKVEEAMAEVVATAQAGLRQMPPGVQPPLIIRYSASSVPILQLSISSETLPEQQLFDITINQLRPQLITIPGVMIPYPYGGRQRQVMVDLEPEKLQAWGIAAQDVSNAINAQNLILPAGTAKIGTQDYPVRLNSSPDVAEQLNDLPLRTVQGTPVYVRDVAHVRDGYQVQTNVVHALGKRGVLLSILKQGNASTLDVVDAVKRVLPEAKKQLPPEVDIELLVDQSVFVRASVEGVVREAVLAAGLTGLMILLFLGSWRSTLIVVTSIPLSILVAVIVLGMLGETLNVMTLGGLALAVGILVDDATVAIENIHRNLHQKKPLVQAILDGASQIAMPSLVATLCICIVFVPVAFLGGAAGFLFTPLAMAVVFAMLTSYFLSRTLLPTMALYLLPGELAAAAGAHRGARGWLARPLVRALAMLLAAAGVALWRGRELAAAAVADPVQAIGWTLALAGAGALLWLALQHRLFHRLHAAFQNAFDATQRAYGRLLAWTLAHRIATAAAFVLFAIGSCAALLPVLGTDFFPAVDAGQIRLHVRAPAGTRIEQTEELFALVEAAVRERVPADELDAMLDNIGIPNSGINLSLSDGTLMSPADGEILISLREGHQPTETHVARLRAELPREFPGLTFFFQPADIVTQVLNFGLSSPIDVQLTGPLRNQPANFEIARRIAAELRGRPGISDVHLQQVGSVPDLRVDVDRTLAAQAGLTQRDVAQNLLVALSGTLQAAPNFWLNPQNGVTYSVIVQTPQREIDSLARLESLPIQAPASDGGAPAPQLLGNLAMTSRGASFANVTHYNIQRTVDVLMNVTGSDLGRAGDQVRSVIEHYRDQLPRGSTITLRGQVDSMRTSFAGLFGGLVFSILLVYLLLAINFQSWLDPWIILMALPGAAAGIVWMLFVTQTTTSVPALMGAIMAVGVATANSILLVTFANDQRRAFGVDARDAALAAGLTRLRPVVMTALAMIIGMLPMSLGLGEGGEQNAPLGRAVIGGLVLATVTTLGFVPVCYASLRRRPPHQELPELAATAAGDLR
jgi:multidrug efflux pump subunit AcrB